MLGDHFEVAKCLIENGAQINVKSKNGNTPLDLAINTHSLGLFKLLVENGAEIDFKEDNDLTLLHYATMESSVEMVKFLAEKGAKIDTKDNDGLTPLHSAVKRGSLEIVKILVEKGAPIDVTNNNNETPFYLANKGNHKGIAKYLLEKKRESENQNPKQTFSDKDPCIICFQPRNALYVLNPCGHTSLCEPCSYDLTNQTYPKCPTCRKPVRDYTKVFYQAP